MCVCVFFVNFLTCIWSGRGSKRCFCNRVCFSIECSKQRLTNAFVFYLRARLFASGVGVLFYNVYFPSTYSFSGTTTLKERQRSCNGLFFVPVASFPSVCTLPPLIESVLFLFWQREVNLPVSRGKRVDRLSVNSHWQCANAIVSLFTCYFSKSTTVACPD